MMFYFGRKAKETGFSLIELMIALVLVNVLVVGSMMMIGTSSTANHKNNEMSWRNIENDEMMKMLTEEEYFGAISSYTENLDLKKCISADAIVCKIDTDYALTPIDLKTGLPLTSLTGAGQESINNSITFRVHCKDNLSECDQAEYFIVKTKTSIVKDSVVTFSTEKTSLVKPLAQKVTTFIPDTTVSSGRPFNAILFIDTSGSMLYAKDKIKDAVDSLLIKLSAMNVNVAIIPLNAMLVTQNYFKWDTVDPTKKIMVEFKDVNPNEILFREEKYTVNYGTQYNLGDSLASPQFRKVQFLITDSVADRNTKVSAAKALIDYLFSSNVDTYKDTPFCSLLHYFENNSSSFPVDPMTPSLVMVITNENDESYLTTTSSEIPTTGADTYNATYKYCMKELNRKVQKGSVQSSYYGKANTYQVTFNATLQIDGAPVAATGVTTQVKTAYNSSIIFGGSCLAASGLESEVLNFLNTSPTYKDKYLGDLSITNCIYRNSTFFYMKTVPTGGLCTSEETTNRNVYPYYIHDSCWENRINEVGSVAASASSVSVDSIVPFASADTVAHSTKDIALAIKNDITNIMGNSNFYFVPVIHSAGDGCTLTPGAQYGDSYADLATKLGMQNNVTPICSSSFTSKVNLDALMTSLAVNDFTLPLDISARFTGIEIVRGVQTLYPANGNEYKIENNLLMFKTGYIQPTDIIRIFYQ